MENLIKVNTLSAKMIEQIREREPRDLPDAIIKGWFLWRGWANLLMEREGNLYRVLAHKYVWVKNDLMPDRHDEVQSATKALLDKHPQLFIK